MAPFTMFWAGHQLTRLLQVQPVGTPLQFVWGGHNADTNFRRFLIQEGDDLFLITVRAGVLFIVARMCITHIRDIQEVATIDPDLVARLHKLSDNTIVLGKDGTPLRLDLAVPTIILERLRYQSQKG